MTISLTKQASNAILALATSRVSTDIARQVNRIRLPFHIPINIDGLAFRTRTLDRVLALLLLRFGALENSETKLFLKSLKPGATVLDIGANLGYYAIMASRDIGPSGKVFAFEPDPENFACLTQNIRKNGCTNVAAYSHAVSDRTGTVALYRSSANSGDHRIYDNGEGRRAQVVQTVALDEFLPPGTKADVIKIDIQGAEPLAFAGMQRTVANSPNVVIFCEFWPLGLKEMGRSVEDLLGFFKQNDFKLSYINEEEGVALPVSQPELLEMCGPTGYVNLYLAR